MIKFFRNIRQNMIKQNKVSNYLLYAIGEILLVVIGILIALQINNQNETNKKHQTEINILNEIILNLDIDLKNLDLMIGDNNTYIYHNTEVLHHLQNDKPINDSLKYHYACLYGHGNFQPNTIGFDNLKSMGIEIIQNEDIREAISELYSFKYFSFVEDRRTVVRKYQELQLEALNNNLRLIKNREIAEPINLNELRQNVPFQNTLIRNIGLLNWVNERYNKGKEEIQAVQQKIRKELER